MSKHDKPQPSAAARYPLRIQTIRSKGQNARYFVYLPLPLAAALGIQGGEEVEWELLERDELRLLRTNPAPLTTANTKRRKVK